MMYLIIELFVLAVAIFFHKFHKLKIFENIWQGVFVFGCALVFGGIWDNYAVYKNHWFYPGEGILGPFLGYIPLEDYFFIIVVTYIILVGYAFSKKKIKIKNKSK